MDNKSIAVLGGSFNPIHFGHLELAKQAYMQFPIEKILVMPSANPSSYKDVSGLLTSDMRCEMITRAIKELNYLELSLLEIERGGVTYTADTLKELKKSYDYIYFIIGADSLFSIDKWYKPEYVLANCHLLASNRNNIDEAVLNERIDYLKNNYNANISFISNVNIPYSSSEIRKLISENKNVSNMLPPLVEAYINENKLYRHC